MLERGFVYVIPDESKILGGVFIKSIEMDHLPAIQEFCDKNKIGYHFTLEQYDKAPCILAIDGNLVIKTENYASFAAFYIPEHVTDNQLMWMFQNKDKFSKYQTIGANLVSGNKDNIITQNIYGMDEIWKYMNKLNIGNSSSYKK